MINLLEAHPYFFLLEYLDSKSHFTFNELKYGVKNGLIKELPEFEIAI